MKAASWTLPTCVAIFLSMLTSAQPAKVIRNVKIGAQTPAFSLVGLDGQRVQEAGYQGEVLLVLFVRPEHETSVKVLRVAQQLLEQRPGSKLAVLAVSTDADAGEYFKRVRSANAISFPVAMDPERKMHGDFGVMVTPTSLLIGPAGQLRYAIPHMPPHYAHRLRARADLLLGRITEKEQAVLLTMIAAAAYGDRGLIETRLRLARDLIDHDQYELAAAVLEELQPGQEDAIPVAALLGTAYLKLGDLDKAAEQLDRLAAYEPAPLNLRVALAHLDFLRQDIGKTEARLLADLRTSPRKSALLFALGRRHEAKGMLTKGLGYYRQALEELFRHSWP